MTREEFMAHAKKEIDLAFSGHRNRMLNLVEQAWAEGKRNAEVDNVMETVKEALERLKNPEPEPEDNDDPDTRACIAAGR